MVHGCTLSEHFRILVAAKKHFLPLKSQNNHWLNHLFLWWITNWIGLASHETELGKPTPQTPAQSAKSGELTIK
jgi:hypothetical protein